MSLEQLEKQILKNAKKEAEEIASRADEQAAALESEVRGRVKQRRAQQQEALKIELAQLDVMHKTQGRMKSKHAILEEQKRLLDDVYDHFLQKLEKNKSTSMKQLFASAKKEITPAIVYVAPRDVSLAKTLFKGVRIEGKDMRGGFIAASRDGQHLVDYSFETILDMMRNRTLQGVSKELFS